MLANSLIILFLIATTCWGGLRVGLFRGLIFFVVTVAAASLAVGMWEPVVLGMLIDPLPRYAWCLGLLVPFAGWLVLLRLVASFLVPDTLLVGRPVNVVGGAVFGALTGVAMSGLVVQGLGFLPLPAGLRWYSPRMVEVEGSITQNPQGRLWVPVDRITEYVLSMLSDGVFNTGHTLSLYQPDFATQAALFRHSYELQESILAVPWSKKVTAVYAWPMPIDKLDPAFYSRLGPLASEPRMQLVVVVTIWESTETIRSQRPQQSQTRLASLKNKGHRILAHLHPPVGWSQRDPATGQQQFNSFVNPPHMLPVLNRQEPLAWVFVIPIAEQAAFLLERNQRLGLAGRRADADTLIAVLGRPGDHDLAPLQDATHP